ncbi:MAG: DUF2800 domain-containing protein, partial [Huintestinicola sp.]
YSAGYADKDTDALTNDELGDLYARVSELNGWIKKLKERIEFEIQNGRPVKGWKIVEGRSDRCFTDVDAAFSALSDKEKIDKSLLYKTTPISLTDAEKLVGKKRFGEICKPWLSKKPGNPTLAPESDKRKAINNSAASDFADVAAPANTETNIKS